MLEYLSFLIGWCFMWLAAFGTAVLVVGIIKGAVSWLTAFFVLIVMGGMYFGGRALFRSLFK